MPKGTIKFYDRDKGFGFVIDEETDESVYFHSSVLPPHEDTIDAGTIVDFSVVIGKKGAQVLNMQILEKPKSVVKAKRKSPDNMIILINELISVLENTNNSYLRHNKYPSDNESKQIATILRAVARNFDV